MFMVIAGGGKVGLNLARELLEKGHELSLIEQWRPRYIRLERELEHVAQYGDATELWVLERAGIHDADAFIASTDDDNINVVIAQIAQRRYQVRNVVVRVFDPDKAAFYEERGLRVVCPTNRAIGEMIAAVDPQRDAAAVAAAIGEDEGRG